ncbi:MAG: AraC-like DNA-binding protein [Cognaticolwellia sp.]|jgi:AraC-like DNA-binding protein
MPALPPDHIAIANVLPAYETSLAAGVSAAELQALGLSTASMSDPDGAVSGEATYRHFEHMAGLPDYAAFLRASVQRHTFGTLGIVGLACKTLNTVHEALICHQRFQHLTNKTARYHSSAENMQLVFREERWGKPRAGLLLVSEYTALVAMQLLRTATGGHVPALALHTRSPRVSQALRSMMEDYLGAPVHVDAEHTALVLDVRVLGLPIQSADPELADYFQAKLHKSAQFVPDEPELLNQVRKTIQYALATGKPTATRIAKQLGMSPRTLQRRLTQHQVNYAQLLEQTRRGLAEKYLADTALTLAEVAYLCGYSEQTSFFRAFRQWTGETPSARRANLLARESR